MLTFCNRIKEIRILKNIKQTELAEFLNIQPRALRFYESGEREPNFETLINICKYLNVSSDYLLGLSDNPDINK